MAVADIGIRRGRAGRASRILILLIYIVIAVVIFRTPLLSDPGLLPTLGVARWITGGLDIVLNDLSLFGVVLKDVTRALANLIDLPGDLLRGALAQGFEFDWGDHWVELRPLSWLGLSALMATASWWIGGPRLGLFALALAIYLLAFDLWAAAATTLASVMLAVPLAAGSGLLLGIAAHRSRAVRAALTPILDLMQTVPVFAYLVPVLLLFGFGAASAVIATMIYAMPPMVRATMTGLERVSEAVIDLGTMVGASRRVQTWKILVPSAAPLIMVGVNQVIMNALNMVIIASMIGAGGLGFEVLDALRKLQLGAGAEAGLAITLLAILLDRLSQKAADGRHRLTLIPRYWWVFVAALLVATSLAAQSVPALAEFPRDWTVTTEAFWGTTMTWLTVNAFDHLEAFKLVVLTWVMFPIRDALLAMPWGLVVAASVWAGHRLGGVRIAALIGSLQMFLLATDIWDLAMITLYLCGVGVAIAALVGTTIGALCYRHMRRRRAALFTADLLQTMPSFVYLIPVVMLFRVGDFAAVVAVAAYAVAPAIRYTIHGLAGVPAPLLEAAAASGCTPRQQFLKVELPMAVPELLLGLNQTIMMGLAMVVITALVGTNDLGQEVYIALASVDPGRGIVAGLGVAFLAIILDRLVMSAAGDYRRRAIG